MNEKRLLCALADGKSYRHLGTVAAGSIGYEQPPLELAFTCEHFCVVRAGLVKVTPTYIRYNEFVLPKEAA